MDDRDHQSILVAQVSEFCDQVERFHSVCDCQLQLGDLFYVFFEDFVDFVRDIFVLAGISEQV